MITVKLDTTRRAAGLISLFFNRHTHLKTQARFGQGLLKDGEMDVCQFQHHKESNIHILLQIYLEKYIQDFHPLF